MAELPELIASFAGICMFAATATAAVLVVGVVLNGRRALDLLRDMAVAAVATIGLTLLLSRIVEGEWTSLVDQYRGSEDGFPVLRAAVIAALAVVSAPHFTRPLRRLGYTAVAAAAIAAVVLGEGSTSDALGGVALGFAVGSAVMLAFGSPLGFPDLSAISEGLDRLGLRVTGLEVRNDRSWGQRVVFGHLDGAPVEVKVLGRDAEGAAALARFWRTLWYRGASGYGDTSRVRNVEHEALMTMVAADRGVPVPAVRGFGLAGDDLAVIVLDHRGVSLAELDNAGDDTIDAMWAALAGAHEAGLVHGAVSASAVLVSDGSARLTNWADSTAFETSGDVAGRADDVVAALYASANRVGTQRAIESARRVLGDDALVEAMPWMQAPALPSATRREADDPKALMSSLREGLVEALGVDPPEPVKLRRVTWGQLGMLVLVFIAANALVGMLGGIDFAAVWDVLRTADWEWIVVGFVIGQLVFLPEATGMLFAVGHPMPLLPLTVLQVAVKFIGLAVPSAAGRVAMNAAFLHKYGLSVTIATTQGAVDGLAGFTVESGILVLALIFGDLSLQLETGDLPWGLILAAVVLLALGAVVAFTRVQKLKEMVLPILKEAWGLFGDVLRDPRRSAGLLGSNLASRVVLGITLWLVLEGIGTPLPLVTAVAVTVATNLLAGLVPIPGGIGVAEATLTALLVILGLQEDAAFAAAVTFRVCTFYFPAVAGFFATGWLRKREYL